MSVKDIERNAALQDVRKWFTDESGKDDLKVIYGIRGGGKSMAVDMIIADLKAKGVKDDNIFRIDFEDPSMRHVKTYRQVVEILKSRKTKGRCYLFLEELTSLLDYEVLMGVLYGTEDYDLTVTDSSKKVFNSDVMKYFEGRVSRRRLHAPTWRRDKGELQRVWGKMMLCDVLGGHVLADATAEQRLAEFLSDRMGELLSMRKISQALDINGHRLHPNTVAEYLKALVDACLIEPVSVYDMFEETVLNVGTRFFWTDLVLRDGRYGAAPEMESERRAYAERYLNLRRTYRKVMCAKSDSFFADFVVEDQEGKKEVVRWRES